MPEVWRKSAPDFQIIIWQSTETVEELLLLARLNRKDYDEYSSFKSETRKREWVTVRAALRLILPDGDNEIIYNNNGRPELVCSQSISISHSGSFIALMVGTEIKTGIDIEEIHPRIEILSRKFLNDNELSFTGDLNRLETLHVIWGAKEVLYKIYSRGGIDFRKDLHVERFEYSGKGQCQASVKKLDFEETFIVYYEKFGDYMIAYAGGELKITN